MDSPYRNRSVEENLDLFQRMRAGEFPDGARTLRAKIDMASPNLNLRDPVMYRIRHTEHHRQGDKWCIYPMYDWAHGLQDSIEGITHSLCSLEYENHRPLYDWFLDQLGIYHPRQIEFARLNMTYTVMSKRRFIELVNGGHVQRLRRPAAADARRPAPPRLHAGGHPRVLPADRRGEDRQHRGRRRAGGLRARRSEQARAARDGRAGPAEGRPRPTTPRARSKSWTPSTTPRTPSAGTRKVPFARELYIERDDFREDPPPKFFRLAPGREVRLRNAYFIKCVDVVKDADGRDHRAALHLRPGDPRRRRARRPQGEGHAALGVGRSTPSRPRRASTTTSSSSRTRTMWRKGRTSLANLNPNSLEVVTCYVEPSVVGAAARHALPVRAPGLLLRRPRLDPGASSSSTAPSPCATPGRRSRRHRPRRSVSLCGTGGG